MWPRKRKKTDVGNGIRKFKIIIIIKRMGRTRGIAFLTLAIFNHCGGFSVVSN